VSEVLKVKLGILLTCGIGGGMVMADNEGAGDDHGNKEVGGPKSPWKTPVAVDADAPVMIGVEECWPALSDAQRPKIPDDAAPTKPPVASPAPPVLQVCWILFFISLNSYFWLVSLFIYHFFYYQKCALRRGRVYREWNCFWIFLLNPIITGL
jgi:hypothetical protein